MLTVLPEPMEAHRSRSSSSRAATMVTASVVEDSTESVTPIQSMRQTAHFSDLHRK